MILRHAAPFGNAAEPIAPGPALGAWRRLGPHTMGAMAAGKKRRKVRVDFRQNRQPRRRAGDLTRQFRCDEQQVVDSLAAEAVRAKGELSRKRTILVDEHEAPLVEEALWRRGVVTMVHGLVCRVNEESGRDWDCTVRRVLRTRLIAQRSPVAVGDQVWFSDQSQHHDGLAAGVIEGVAPRRSLLSRRDPRGREHAMVANADQILIVSSVARPRPKPHLIDRYLVAAVRGELRALIAFNKYDLRDPLEETGQSLTDRPDDPPELDEASHRAAPDGQPVGDAELSDAEFELDTEEEQYSGPALTLDELIEEYRELGYTVLLTSAASGAGLDELGRELCGHSTIIAGQSGVGKSSLINALQPGLRLEVQEVSADNEKGRHTTTLARLLRLDRGGYVVDTPGIRQFGLWSVAPGELEACFVEFIPRVAGCKFKDCHHVGDEPGCAIVAAVEAGEISLRRYLSYLKLLREMSRS